MTPHPATLADWLARIERLHPREIELGLERVAAVAARMRLDRPAVPVITVGGTNGKGSCVRVIEALLCAAGERVGAYTSPHLCRYNERVRVAGRPVSDAALCDAFARVEHARRDIALTYFEFGTLAALAVFRDAGASCLVLEVGLGGRLDAVNLVDADVAVVTSVQIDHTDWLGHDRDAIGREKAGIFRARRPAICADPEPPASVLAAATQLDVTWLAIGQHFGCETTPAGGWRWHGRRRDGVPLAFTLPRPPRLLGANVAAALQALALLDRLPDSALLEREIPRIFLPGRLQRLDWRGIECVLDVAHNPAGIELLCASLARDPARRTAVVFGAMRDKDHAAMLAALAGIGDHLLLVDLAVDGRGASAAELASGVPASRPVVACRSVAAALETAFGQLREGDRLVACGSFHVVGPALEWFESMGVQTGVSA